MFLILNWYLAPSVRFGALSLIFNGPNINLQVQDGRAGAIASTAIIALVDVIPSLSIALVVLSKNQVDIIAYALNFENQMGEILQMTFSEV